MGARCPEHFGNSVRDETEYSLSHDTANLLTDFVESENAPIA